LALFGFGYHGYRRDLQTVVVMPAGSGLPSDPQEYDTLGATGVRVIAVTADRVAAEARLRNEEIDLVVVIPANAEDMLRQGKQAELTIEMNQVDPVQANYATFMAQTLTAAVTREISRRGAAAGQAYALTIGG